MKVHDEYIPEERFKSFLQIMPQVSVELLVERNQEVLLVKRENEPAKGEWFIPGARLYKGETFKQAVSRIARKELSIEVELIDRLGVYNHFWESGDLPDVKQTHTVNIVHHVRPNDKNVIDLDSQHSEYRYSDGTDLDLHPYINQYLQDMNSTK